MPAISSFSYLPNMECVKDTLYNLYICHFMMYVILGLFWVQDECPKDENPKCPNPNPDPKPNHNTYPTPNLYPNPKL